ncbi:MAG: hypothetical protein DWQ44_12140 [Bacteroidetes bacterium]|nr:MAG: hypothetical protein DWQ33_07870 [Bacteroidota bacterium]REK08031.1 MAG: hypothetical protein DWQ39_00285 [Bacteroidota bacterium]REK32236.1 MAG: hypothetical protein DWQ44_12140 [Bacteroidota bacterium]REK47388.1 MAG: hypothetical protein DWQ48_12710 [Bacteroidota bacterium]
MTLSIFLDKKPQTNFHIKALIIITVIVLALNNQVRSLHSMNPTYAEIITAYSELDKNSEYARLFEGGKCDNGKPLHVFVIDKSKHFSPVKAREQKNLVLLINNGIHAGEPDGVNASLQFARELLSGKAADIPDSIIICIIPIHNVEGSMQRGCCSRVNQNGPDEYGFRANGQYLDLNRDFIKSDALNTDSWKNFFHYWNPDVLLDTHVSNGADYQYTMTLVSTQHNKLYPILGDYLHDHLSPRLFKHMKEKGQEMMHYVNTKRWNLPPDSGLIAFLETPRYSSGYAALFSTIGFIAETHMLKPYDQRLAATLDLIKSLVKICSEEKSMITALRKTAIEKNKNSKHFPVNWKLDENKFEEILFKGFEYKIVKSSITGLNRQLYDRNSPYEKKIKFYPYYKASDTITAPRFYLVPQAWKKIIPIMRSAGITVGEIKSDSMVVAEISYIEDYNTVSTPYEGRYLHSNTKISRKTEKVKIEAGDFIIPVNQDGIRYIIETLEPISVDSYFNWGFFDAILQQKEWFSDYVFEDLAAELLEADETLKNKFEEFRDSNPTVRENAFEQLYFIYKNSEYFEKGFRRYPVLRLL